MATLFEEITNHLMFGEFDRVIELIKNETFETLRLEQHGLNLLHIAARYGTVEMLELLITKGMDPKRLDRDEVSPFSDALIYKKEDNYMYLLEKSDIFSDNQKCPFLFIQSVDCFDKIFSKIQPPDYKTCENIYLELEYQAQTSSRKELFISLADRMDMIKFQKMFLFLFVSNFF
jgi:ankyrin repeat protein